MSASSEVIRELASFCRKNKLALNDPKSHSLFFTSIKGSIDESLNNPILKYGKHVETMFEAMVVGFGNYRLLKIEDCGRVHPQASFKIPDFRMNRYAEETRSELKIAVFWSKWGVWTLIAPSELSQVGNKFQIEFGRAVQINEMMTLGDVSIGTTSPLRLRLFADTSKPRILNPDNTANMTIGDFKAFSEEREIVDSIDRKIFFMLIEYGRWTCEGPTAILDDSQQLEAIEFMWQPEEASDQGFDFIGELSSLFSRYYARQTVKEGEIVQIEAEFVPDWFGPLMSRDYKSSALPLWRFLIQPNREKPSTPKGNQDLEG